MKLKLGVLIGAIFTGLTIYKVKNYKVGPCSPELEDRLKGGREK